MELKNLYTVKKIIETGSYQKAAMSLNYAQSTITFQVQQLEKEFGFKIFEKQGKYMVLSQDGKKVLPLINKIIATSDELLNIRNSDSLTGSLSIAVPESLITYKLQPLLAEFKKKAPDVKLTIQVMNCYKIYEQVKKGEIDIGIHYDIEEDSNIKKKDIAEYELVLVSSPNIENEKSDFTTPNQIKNICFIQNDHDALYLKIFDQYLKTNNIILNPSLELWSIEAIKRSVNSNLGVTFLPKFTVENELRSGFLKKIDIDLPSYIFKSVYTYKNTTLPSASLRLIIKLLDNYIEEIKDSN